MRPGGGGGGEAAWNSGFWGQGGDGVEGEGARVLPGAPPGLLAGATHPYPTPGISGSRQSRVQTSTSKLLK